MLKLTKTGIGLLTRQYRSVLKKCFLINAGLFFALAPVNAEAAGIPAADEKMALMNNYSSSTKVSWTSYSTTGTEQYDVSTHTGVQKINVDGTDYYFTYVFNPTGAGNPGTQDVFASNVYYEGKTKTGQGGALRSDVNATVPSLQNDYFVGNQGFDGGAIWSSSIIENIKASFVANTATQYGGALHNGYSGHGGTMKNIDGIFVGNKSHLYGGAFDNFQQDNVESLKGIFVANSADMRGGAIQNITYIDTIVDSSFLSNSGA
jgi:hypothetical protein